MDLFLDTDTDTTQERTRRYLNERERYNAQHRYGDGAPITLMRTWCDGYGDVCTDCGMEHPCEC